MQAGDGIRHSLLALYGVVRRVAQELSMSMRRKELALCVAALGTTRPIALHTLKER